MDGQQSLREDTDHLSQLMGDLVRELQVEHADVDDTLHAITAAAVAGVPGVDHAGISLVVDRSRIDSRGPTDERVQRLDARQSELNEGPCLNAIREHETVRIDDMATDKRWPRFAAAALECGVGSSLSFLLFVAQNNLGALNLYSESTHAFTDESHETGLIFATHAAIALAGAQHEAGMRVALDSRDLVGQAKGILMARFDVDAVRAFAALVRLSQHHNIRLVQVARMVCDSRGLPVFAPGKGAVP